MAYLRDAKTMHVIAEGTPLELAHLVDELGIKAGVVQPGKTARGLDVVYDDVGLGFDPQSVLTAHAEEVTGLRGAAEDREIAAEERKRLRKHADGVERVVSRARGMAKQVPAIVEQARDPDREDPEPIWLGE